MISNYSNFSCSRLFYKVQKSLEFEHYLASPKAVTGSEIWDLVPMQCQTPPRVPETLGGHDEHTQSTVDWVKDG